MNPGRRSNKRNRDAYEGVLLALGTEVLDELAGLLAADVHRNEGDLRASDWNDESHTWPNKRFERHGHGHALGVASPVKEYKGKSERCHILMLNIEAPILKAATAN